VRTGSALPLIVPIRTGKASGTGRGVVSELRFVADQFEQALSVAAHTDWVVYAKPPFGGPEQVLKYLARYTHRAAISNARLLDFEDGMVRFRYKDYAHGNRKRVMTLTALEFSSSSTPRVGYWCHGYWCHGYWGQELGPQALGSQVLVSDV
jgi:Putative transposase